MDYEEMRNMMQEAHHALMRSGWEQYRRQIQNSSEPFEEYRKNLIKLDIIDEHLQELYSNSKEEINISKWNLTKNLKPLFHAILDVIEVNQNFNIAQVVNRMIADRLSILKLIFDEKNEYIIKLRLYLYALDDCYNDRDLFVHAIKKERSNLEFKRKYEDIERDIKYLESQVKTIINKLNDYKISDNVLSKRYWRFKIEGNRVQGNYSYKHLYINLFSTLDYIMPDVLSNLSSYAHGLLSSNIGGEMNNKKAQTAIALTNQLLVSYIEAMIKVFPNEKCFILSIIKAKHED